MHDSAGWMTRANTALLVVDMQNDYCHPAGGLATAGVLPYRTSMIEAMAPVLIRAIEAARQQAMRLIWIRTEYGDSTTSRNWLHRGAGQPLHICRPGSWGAEWYLVAPRADEIVITKHRYSPFVNTPLETVLRAQSISTVVITGATTNVCVESTARDAFMRDYRVVVLADCTASYDRSVHEASLLNLSRHFGTVMESGEMFRLVGAEQHNAAVRSEPA